MKKYYKIKLLTLLLLVTGWVQAQEVKQWSLEDLKHAVEKSDKPTVLNFWATFCKPCIAEMPHFQELADKYRSQGVEMIFVSVDLPEAYPGRIGTFARQLKITSPIAFLTESNADEFCPVVDKSWSGAIPATVLINPATGYRKFFEEEIKKDKLEALILEMIKKP